MNLPIIAKKEQQPVTWSDLPWGKHHLSTLNHYFSGHWSKIFGFHLVKLGALSREISTENCAVIHQLSVDQQLPATIQADPCHLPLLDKSIDACLVAHTLHYCQDAHQLLREIDRVLIDDGWLLLSSVNPVSVMGLCNLYWQIRRAPMRTRLFSQWRIKDWLALLNYEVIDCASLQVQPWCSHLTDKASLLSRLFGSINVIIARKRTTPITMIRLPRRAAMPVLTKPMVGATNVVNQPIPADKRDQSK